MASTPPEAPKRWPVMDLVELIERFLAAFSPSAILIALSSFRSPTGVEVPWELIQLISSAAIPESLRVIFIALAGPYVEGAVM